MASVGSQLRREREAQGRAIEDIAQELCVMSSYLRAIENDDLEALPGVFFYKSFVKQYAKMLGLSPSSLQPGIDALCAAAEPEPEPEAPKQAPIRVPDPIVQAANRLDISTRTLTAPAIALLLAVVGGAMFYSWWKQPARAEVQQADVQTGVAQSSMRPASSSSSTSAEPSVDVKTTTDESGMHHIELAISANEETWVSITSEGKSVFSGVLQPDQTKVLTGLEVAKMKVGNAGGLNVQVNGKAIGPLGEKGQVRVVVFTPEGFNILPGSVPQSNPAETL